MLSFNKGLFVFLVGVISLLSFSALHTNGQLQCPAELLTVFDNGTIEFAPVSEGSGPVDASYDPGAAGGWYALANGFVDVVRSGGLPYDILVPVVNMTFINSQGQSFDPLTLLQSFASWWAGILVVTLLGIFIGISFCICGCCFWCCRCCGNCGGAKSQKARDNNDCLTFTFAIILLLVTLVLLAAVVLAFFSNEQTFRSLNNLQTTLNSVANDTGNYLSDTVQEVYDIICQLAANGGVVDEVVDEVNGVGTALNDTIMDISSQVNDIVNQLNDSVLQDVNTLVRDLNSTNTDLVATTAMLTASLTSVVSNIQMAQTTLMCSTVPSSFCTTLASVEATTQSALDGLPTIPDIGTQLNEVQTSLEGIGGDIVSGQNSLMDTLGPSVTDQINSTIAGLTGMIEMYNTTIFSLVDQVTAGIDPILNNSFTASQCPSLDGFAAFSSVVPPTFNFNLDINNPSGGTASNPPPVPAGSFTLTLGYIRECIINASFEYIEQFDVYRYAFGIIVCSLSLIVIVLAWIGILFGLIGFRKDRYPNDRSSLSHCGGICLLVSVGFTFLFGFFLLLLSAIFFFFGANSLKVCQSLQGPNYEIFARTIDDPAIRSSFQGLAAGAVDINEIPSISGLFRDCEQNNTALFTALNLGALLGNVLPTGTISGAVQQQLNISQLQGTLDTALSDAAASLNIDPSGITDLVQMGLNNFQNVSFGDLNVTGYTTQIDQAVATADLNGSIEALRNISIDLAGLGQDVTPINNIITELENIRDNIVPTLISQVGVLETQVSSIEGTQTAVLSNVNQIVMDTTNLITNISGPVLDDFINGTVRGAANRSFDYLFQYIDHLDEQVLNTVGGCQPVYGIYTQLHNAVCRNFLDGLNGFWWSLGFCAILYVPLIIFAVVASSFFLKKKSNEGDDDGYLDYPMKSY